MKKILIIILIFLLLPIIANAKTNKKEGYCSTDKHQNIIQEEKYLFTQIDGKFLNLIKGSILFQTERNGEGWYVDLDDLKKYYLGNPYYVFKVMQNSGLGIKHNELEKYLKTGFPYRLAGRILLDVENNGEAYYVKQQNLKGYYLGRPDNAFKVLAKFGSKITNRDLRKIYTGEIN